MDTATMPTSVRTRPSRQALTADLSWPMAQADALFPARQLEGIQVHDWSALKQALWLRTDHYWKLQGEKDKRLYAVTDAFAQNNGQLGISDPRYVNALKCLLQAFTPIEYGIHRGFSRVARQLGLTDASMASVDALRHQQLEVHGLSHFNKYFNGMHSPTEWFDHHGLWAVAKSYIDDLNSAGPFEFLVALGAGYYPVISQTLYVPFMSGAADNADMSTSSVGLSVQSDNTRQQALCQSVIEFLATQEDANRVLLQSWIDKWFWRSVQLSNLIAVMHDYMLTYHAQSWHEAWHMYVEAPLSRQFKVWEGKGLSFPSSWQQACEQQVHASHRTWLKWSQYAHSLPLHVWAPSDASMQWLASKYPSVFAALYHPHLMGMRHAVAHSATAVAPSDPVLCGTCQLPVPGLNADLGAQQAKTLKGRCFCSLPCQNIFNLSSDKHSSQALHSELLSHWTLSTDYQADSGWFEHSDDRANFSEWNGGAPIP